MKKLLLTAALIVSAAAATAQAPGCGSYTATVEHMINDRGEVKMLELHTDSAVGNDHTDFTELWIDLSDGSYTIIYVSIKNDWTCIIDSGDSSRAASRDETPDLDAEPEGEEG